jgi:hypothetical protein
MLSQCRTLLLAAGLMMSLTLGAGPAAADDGPPIPEPGELMTLVRDTVLAVDKGNKTADYSALHAMAAATFQAAYPAEKLASLFTDLRATTLDMEPVRSKLPQTTRAPTLDLNGRLRIVGYFEFPSTQLVYDFIYEYDAPGRRWRLASIALKPRALAPQPDLIQPQ